MSIVFTVFVLFFAAVAAGVLLSNLFAWYEAANRQPSLLEDGFTGPRLLFAGRLLATETLLLFFTLLLRPLGWGPSRPTHIRSRRNRNGLPAKGAPVLLLHGLFHNSGCWWWTRRRLRQQGMAVFALNLPLWRRSITGAAVRVGRMVDDLRISRGVEKVHLVGHSMGGLVALHYLQNGGADKVGRCILLGAPVRGSKLAILAISPMGRGLLPGSAFLRDLLNAKLPEQVRTTAIYSRHDNLVLPPENARLDGAKNIELEEVQHTSLLYHPRAVNALIAELKETP